MHDRGISLSLCLLLSAVFVCTPARAQESAPLLRWSQVEEAISSHPAFRTSKEDVSAAEGEVKLSRQYPNPDFAVSLGAAAPDVGTGAEFIWDVELTFPMEWPGRYICRSESASFGVEAAAQEARASRLEVWRQLRALYLTSAFDQEKLRLLRETEEELLRFVEAVRIRVDKGEARPIEFSRAQAELEEYRISISTAISEAVAHRQQLNVWLGGGLPEQFEVEVDLDSFEPLPGLDEAIQSALTKHPAIRAAEARGRQAASAATAERHTAVPGLSAGGFYGQELDSTNYGGLLSIELPLWNWNLGGIASADAEKRRAQAQIDLKEREIKESVIAARAKAQAANQALQRYRDVLLPVSEKTLLDMERLYKSGEAGLTDVLDARRVHLRLQSAYQTELFNYQMAMLELSVWMGGNPRA